MEANASSEEYQIRKAKIPIRLALRRIDELHPHERPVPADLERLVTLLQKEPVLRHPLVADESTGLVLDGTHRLAALAELDCSLAPCALVDYRNPKIVVDRWFRKVEGQSLENFTKKIMDMHPTVEENLHFGEKCLSSRACFAVIESQRSGFTFPTSETDSILLAEACFEIEKIARSSGLQITYEDSKSMPLTDGFLLSTIAVTKQEILNACTQNRVYPPKTTRHVIPSRPLGVGAPLEWLKEPEPKKPQETFLKHLKSKTLVRKPEGSFVGSRRYQEETFVFE